MWAWGPPRRMVCPWVSPLAYLKPTQETNLGLRSDRSAELNAQVEFLVGIIIGAAAIDSLLQEDTHAYPAPNTVLVR
jgi:hypothetical protein